MIANSIKRYWVVGIIVFAVVSCILFWWLVKSTGPDVATYQQERVLKFSYELANTTNRALSDVKFSAYLPVVETSNQFAEILITDDAYSLDSSVLGNRVARFEIDLIPPFGKKKIAYTAIVKTAEQANSLPILNREQYLQQETFIESKNEDIVSLAKALRGASDIESAKNIFTWVSSRLKDSGYTSQDKGALYALGTLEGDCTEHMYLTIALARAIGIPSRGVGGFVYKKSRVVSAAEYHNWAELYIDNKWQILDTQKKSFMQSTQDYIAMRVLSSSKVSLLGNSHRFLVASDGVSVSMN